MRKMLGCCLANQRGAAVIEFAIAGPFLIAALVGLLEAGRLLWISHTMQQAVDEAGRYAMINRTGDTATLTTYLQGKLGSPDASLVIEVTQSSAGGITYVNIAARKPFELAGGLFGTLESAVGGRTSVPLLPSS
ncbi:TadE/TadG family type IV pilus assembly protein [Desertibaculum subflavum]|uniref:TadE/TadG family type IV pilus assembly protein n=1 Tax=Desertibaculum subflavum TaxID=2268458 RepID=UPI0013C44ADC